MPSASRCDAGRDAGAAVRAGVDVDEPGGERRAPPGARAASTVDRPSRRTSRLGSGEVHQVRGVDRDRRDVVRDERARGRPASSRGGVGATPPGGRVVGEDLERRGADRVGALDGLDHAVGERQVGAEPAAVGEHRRDIVAAGSAVGSVMDPDLLPRSRRWPTRPAAGRSAASRRSRARSRSWPRSSACRCRPSSAPRACCDGGARRAVRSDARRVRCALRLGHAPGDRAGRPTSAELGDRWADRRRLPPKTPRSSAASSRRPADHDPGQEEAAWIVVRYLRDRCFTEDRPYPEKEVNQRLALFHPDVATLRRAMVDEGLMARECRRLPATAAHRLSGSCPGCTRRPRPAR